MKTPILTAASILLVSSLAAGQGGDDCSSATAIAGQGSFSYNNFGATDSGVQPTCSPAVGTLHRDVWFKWTPDATGQASVSLCGPGNNYNIDSVMAIWKAGEGCPPLRIIACNNDACAIFGPSANHFAVVAGEEYLIQLGTISSAVQFSGVIQAFVSPIDPGDYCEVAVPFAGEGILDFDNLGYSVANHKACINPASTLRGDYWVRWTADATGLATVSNCAFFQSINTIVSVWDDSQACPPTTLITCNDNACGLTRSQVTFSVVAGTTYLVQVGHLVHQDLGPEKLEFEIAAPPANDECASAEAIVGTGTFLFDTTLATLDNAGSSCGAPDRNIWYDWSAPTDGRFVIDTCGSSLDTRLAVWESGACPPTAELACDDDSCGTASRVAIDATMGTHYTIEILGDEGVGDLNITRVDPACSTKTSSIGCEAQISFTGSPTTSGPDNFSVEVSQVNGQTTGCLTWGFSQAPPFNAGSTRPRGFEVPGVGSCIYAQLIAATDSSGGTSGFCDGTLTFQLSQKTLALGGFGIGSTMIMRCVYRDPPSTGGVAHSAALEFVVN